MIWAVTLQNVQFRILPRAFVFSTYSKILVFSFGRAHFRHDMIILCNNTF